MERVRAAVRATFVEYHGIYVGQGAHGLARSGWRLTWAEKSPAELDLRIG
jgi:hypothetical protein